MVIFHSYVKLPEGIICFGNCCECLAAKPDDIIVVWELFTHKNYSSAYCCCIAMYSFGNDCCLGIVVARFS